MWWRTWRLLLAILLSMALAAIVLDAAGHVELVHLVIAVIPLSVAVVDLVMSRRGGPGLNMAHGLPWWSLVCVPNIGFRLSWLVAALVAVVSIAILIAGFQRLFRRWRAEGWRPTRLRDMIRRHVNDMRAAEPGQKAITSRAGGPRAGTE